MLAIASLPTPLDAAGVQRPLKFVKYMPQFGCAPMVVSSRSCVDGARDTTLLREVPDSVQVARPPGFPLGRWLAILFGKLLRRLRLWALWPDGGLGRAPAAFSAARRELRHQRRM